MRLSEIYPIPWFLTEEVEVLVDPSSGTSLDEFEPGTNYRDYLLRLIVLQSYVRILLFVHHLAIEEHFRISNVPPHSTVSLDWMHKYPENTFA